MSKSVSNGAAQTNNNTGSSTMTITTTQVPGVDMILVIASFHQKFLNEIHPFSDGNGRDPQCITCKRFNVISC